VSRAWIKIVSARTPYLRAGLSFTDRVPHVLLAADVSSEQLLELFKDHVLDLFAGPSDDGPWGFIPAAPDDLSDVEVIAGLEQALAAVAAVPVPASEGAGTPSSEDMDLVFASAGVFSLEALHTRIDQLLEIEQAYKVDQGRIMILNAHVEQLREMEKAWQASQIALHDQGFASLDGLIAAWADLKNADLKNSEGKREADVAPADPASTAGAQGAQDGTTSVEQTVQAEKPSGRKTKG
jgi:hypothetical protein